VGSDVSETIEAPAGPLRALVDALSRGRPLFWTGEVLVEVDVDFPAGVGQATMVLDADDMAALRGAIEQRCRQCGCAESNACVLMIEGCAAHGCRWVEQDLCSACVPGASPDWRRPAKVAELQHPGRTAA
jgi:hypothetical protein